MKKSFVAVAALCALSLFTIGLLTENHALNEYAHNTMLLAETIPALVVLLVFGGRWIQEHTYRSPVALKSAAVTAATTLILMAIVVVPFLAGQNLELLYPFSPRSPHFLIIGADRAEGFGRQVHQYLMQDSRNWKEQVVFDYMRIDDLGLPRSRDDGEYAERLAHRVAVYLAHSYPQAIISADTSTTVSYVMDIAKKMALPTIVVAATKGGIVHSENENALQFLPPNLAQAEAMSEIRREIARLKNEQWIAGDVQRATGSGNAWLAYLAAKAKYQPAEPPKVRPPKVVFGFIHDGSEFSVDLKTEYFALQSLDNAELENSSTLVFSCGNESEMATALSLGHGVVVHWFVALYDRKAQDFQRAKSALEAKFPSLASSSVTYCDSAYGEWMFGDKRNASVLLPVYLENEVVESSHPLFAEIDGAHKRKYRASLNRKENCYGPFASDAVAMLNATWRDFQRNPAGTFTEYFHETVMTAAANGQRISVGTPALPRSVLLYRLAFARSEAAGPVRKHQEIDALKGTSSCFHAFPIGSRLEENPE